LPEFPQTCPKTFCATFAYKLFPTNIMKTIFWCDLPKIRSSCVFLQTLGAIVWSQTTLRAIFPGFLRILSRFSGILPKCLEILPGFSTNKKFWCFPCAFTSLHYCKYGWWEYWLLVAEIRLCSHSKTLFSVLRLRLPRHSYDLALKRCETIVISNWGIRWRGFEKSARLQFTNEMEQRESTNLHGNKLPPWI